MILSYNYFQMRIKMMIDINKELITDVGFTTNDGKFFIILEVSEETYKFQKALHNQGHWCSNCPISRKNTKKERKG